ncbi:hypothetical protein OHA46_27675 [Streptomyces sp. NBC_00708]
MCAAYRLPSGSDESCTLGVVISRKEGKQVYYRADGATMTLRVSALQARCCPPDRNG